MTTAVLHAGWCAGVVVVALGGYVAVGTGVIAVVGEPVRATIVVSAVVAGAVLGVRRVRPGWLAHPVNASHRTPALPPAEEASSATPTPTKRSRLAHSTWVAVSLVCAVVAGQSWAVWLYSAQGSAGFDRTVEVRQSAGVLLTLVLALVTAPIAEECLFRGLVYPLLRRRIGIVVAAVVTAVVFALVHGNLVQGAVAGPLALVLALVYEHTRRLWPCIVIHLGFNLAAVLVPPAVFAVLAAPLGLGFWTVAFVIAWVMTYQGVNAGTGGER